jgi:3'-phosphoadenosine 5'-phosphosulfate (PAPS) 3'-phosphatase
MNDIIKATRPVNICRVAGAGNKFVYLLDQKADYYINLVPGLKYWDMCASEALMMARMGIVTDAYLRPLIYDHTKSNYTVMDGIIAAKNKKVHDVASRRIYEGTGKDLPSLHRMVQAESRERRAKRAKMEANSKPQQ